jgi:hypothetical protein
MLYTKSAADRILTIATKIEAVRELANCIQVTYKINRARCSTFISKKTFAADFVEFRKAAADEVVVTVNRQIPGQYVVHSAGVLGQVYSVSLDKHLCTCPDHSAQEDAGIENPTCKHLYAVMNHAAIQKSKVLQFGRPAPTYFKGIAIS